MSDTTTQETRGGIIRLSHILLTKYLLPIPMLSIENTDTQGMLREEGVFTALHNKLLLPESFEIRAMQFQMQRREWLVYVESPDLPVTEEAYDFPTIDLHYTQRTEEEEARRKVMVTLDAIHLDGKPLAITPERTYVYYEDALSLLTGLDNEGSVL